MRPQQMSAGAAPWRRRRALLGALLAGVTALVGVGLTVPTAAPAQAVTGITVAGRGFGHGHGLSQHGAKGRAEAGHTYEQILAAYYPGTGRATTSDYSQTIRVWIQDDRDSEVRVRREAVMSVATTGRARTLPATVAGQVPSHWRLRLDGARLVLEAQVGSSWVDHGDTALTALLQGAPSAVLAGGDGTLRLVLGTTYREYTGTVSAVRVPTSGSEVVRTVVSSSVHHYLRSVVPAEMPAGWSSEALKAQAVAARSYATFDKGSKSASAWYDTCDTTSCQVYRGVADYDAAGRLLVQREDDRATAAVTATNGVLVTHGGQAAFTQFSASNGGWSATGSRPYLRAAEDRFDAFPAWSVDLTGARIAAAYPAIGVFTDAAVVARDGQGPFGGRATTVRLTGSRGSVNLTGAQFRSAFGLRSTLLTIQRTGDPIIAPQRDWNGDRGPDLIGRAPTGRLNFYPGGPDATWGRAVQIGHGWGSMRLMTQIHDFSGTGSSELVSTNHDGLLFLYPGDGRGGWASPVRLGQGWWGFDMLVGVQGWHAEGRPALLARKASTGRLYLYPGDGRQGWGATVDLGAGWNKYDALLAAGDWDGDGRVDLIGRVAATGELELVRGNGRGGVLSRAVIGRGWGGMDEIVGAADWDRDGRYDLIAREDGTGRLWLYPGNGAGGFLQPRQIGHGWTGFALVK